MIPKEIEAEILRLHFAEKWPKTTIAKQVGVHHTVVHRVLINNGVRQDSLKVRPSIADPYMGFILSTLEKYQDIRATRLFHMVKERGYPGSVDHYAKLRIMVLM